MTKIRLTSRLWKTRRQAQFSRTRVRLHSDAPQWHAASPGDRMLHRLAAPCGHEHQRATGFATTLETRHPSPTTHFPEGDPLRRKSPAGRLGRFRDTHPPTRPCFQRIVAGNSSATHTALQISLHGTPAAKASSTVQLSSSCRAIVDAQLPAYSPPSTALSLDHNSTSRM